MGNVLHDQSSVWFWVIGGICTAVGLALVWYILRLIKRLFLAVMRYWGTLLAPFVQEWLRVPLHEDLVPQMQAVKDTVGEKNGDGALTEMVSKILADQAETVALRAEWSTWREHHDAQDAATREDVASIKRLLGQQS